MNKQLDVLKRCILFRDFSDEALKEWILPNGRMLEVAKDHCLIRYQEQVNHFGVVVSGKINTLHYFADGSYSIIDAIETAEIVGADLVWTRSRISPYYAVSAVPASVFLFPVSMVTQQGTLPENCRMQIITKFLTLVSHDNIRKDYRLATLSQKGLRDRILTYLTMQADKRRSATFQIPFSREELASYLCVNRSALSHELSMMRRDGLITFRKNCFTLLFREKER
ncbi:MAG: Crp/Fnr family transcriptional regulator [Oscillospiraceae bacterium]|nr:Crp/Fnr family transcriptional regulator [Oscillospiraceae bacterium]